MFRSESLVGGGWRGRGGEGGGGKGWREGVEGGREDDDFQIIA